MECFVPFTVSTHFEVVFVHASPDSSARKSRNNRYCIRIERMTGFEPAVSCLGSRRAATAPHPRRAAGGRPLSAYSIAGTRRLDMTSFPGMSALARGGMPHVVEPAGFEPATFPLRTGRPATGRRPRNAPDRRTCDLPIRRPTLCPIGLRGCASAHATACVPARAGKRIMALAWSRTRQKKVPVSHAIVPARGECTASRAGGVHAMSRFEPRAGHDPATFRLRGGRSAC